MSIMNPARIPAAMKLSALRLAVSLSTVRALGLTRSSNQWTISDLCSTNYYKCEKACRRVDDQRILTTIAVYHHSPGIRTEAALRISDQGFLTDFLAGNVETDAWKAAKLIQKIDRSDYLERLTVGSVLEQVRLEVLERVENQSLLAELALRDAAWRVRRKAASRLRDEPILRSISANDEVGLVRLAAGMKLPGFNAEIREVLGKLRRLEIVDISDLRRHYPAHEYVPITTERAAATILEDHFGLRAAPRPM